MKYLNNTCKWQLPAHAYIIRFSKAGGSILKSATISVNMWTMETENDECKCPVTNPTQSFLILSLCPFLLDKVNVFIRLPWCVTCAGRPWYPDIWHRLIWEASWSCEETRKECFRLKDPSVRTRFKTDRLQSDVSLVSPARCSHPQLSVRSQTSDEGVEYQYQVSVKSMKLLILLANHQT